MFGTSVDFAKQPLWRLLGVPVNTFLPCQCIQCNVHCLSLKINLASWLYVSFCQINVNTYIYIHFSALQDSLDSVLVHFSIFPLNCICCTTLSITPTLLCTDRAPNQRVYVQSEFIGDPQHLAYINKHEVQRRKSFKNDQL